MRTLAFFLPALLTLAACSGAEDKDDSGLEADTDTDTDTDSDTDTDTDTDTDVDAIAADFAGTASYKLTVGSDTICDVDVDLVGTPYAGDCEGCTYAFDMDATVTRDDGTSDCSLPATYTFVADDTWTNPTLFFWETFEGYYGNYYNVAAMGGEYTYYGSVYEGPYFQFFAYDGSYYMGTFSVNGGAAEWSFDYSGSYYAYNYYNSCGSTEFSSETSAASTSGGTGDVPCDGMTADVWEIRSTGGNVTVSVDTVGADSTFDPVFYLNDESGCTVAFADDNFDCAFPPPTYQCPSYSANLAAGTYYVVVASSFATDECAGTDAGYELKVDGAEVVGVSSDDAALYSATSYTESASGSGTITPR
jgi:hypothetical protein